MADLQVLKEQLGKLTVLEIAQLTKELEQDWGVSAAAPVAAVVAPVAAAGGAAGPAAAAEEKSEFTPVLAEIGAQKIQVIKVVREVTGLGLKEAKALVDGTPSSVKESVSKEEANTIKEKLEAVGAKVEIK
jgi:large subunit ribosomal protein L7/L12